MLKSFDLHGCGRFLTGRRGQPSRFNWAYSATEIANEVVGAVPPPPDEVVFVEHKIWLRPGVQVTVQMPENTTRDEAEKVAGVVRNLWLVTDDTKPDQFGRKKG
jgi:hypothetical protein